MYISMFVAVSRCQHECHERDTDCIRRGSLCLLLCMFVAVANLNHYLCLQGSSHENPDDAIHNEYSSDNSNASGDDSADRKKRGINMMSCVC